ncbi:hypothetical protein BH23ACT9_BH23ACT9_04460 [soil metagenome]
MTLTPEELAGDLPLVCVRTGRTAEALTPVWFARSPWWTWAPLLGLCAWAALRADWAPLATWWAAGALLLPLLVSRGVTGRLPLDASTRQRLTALRTRRFRVIVSALLLTWVAVSLYLIGSQGAGVVVLAVVMSLYALAVGMVLAGRMISVRGVPQQDGGVTIREAHEAFVAALELRRTGHRP